jgi:hypothetical protein
MINLEKGLIDISNKENQKIWEDRLEAHIPPN